MQYSKAFSDHLPEQSSLVCAKRYRPKRSTKQENSPRWLSAGGRDFLKEFGDLLSICDGAASQYQAVGEYHHALEVFEEKKPFQVNENTRSVTN